MKLTDLRQRQMQFFIGFLKTDKWKGSVVNMKCGWTNNLLYSYSMPHTRRFQTPNLDKYETHNAAITAKTARMPAPAAAPTREAELDSPPACALAEADAALAPFDVGVAEPG